MTAWIAWALSLPGFAALSLAMPRHQEQVFGRTLGQSATLAARLAGSGLLALALGVCATQWGWSVAVVAWLGVLSLAAVVVGLGLSYWPRRLPWLAVAALALGLGAWLWRAAAT